MRQRWLLLLLQRSIVVACAIYHWWLVYTAPSSTEILWTRGVHPATRMVAIHVGCLGHGRRSRRTTTRKLWRNGLNVWLDIVFSRLGRQHTFGSVSMSLPLAIFLVRVLDGDFFVHEVLAVHVGDSFIGCFESRERDETVAL